jgi:hypothetical protein
MTEVWANVPSLDFPITGANGGHAYVFSLSGDSVSFPMRNLVCCWKVLSKDFKTA